jgi:lipopolysaccharide export system protein LptC
MSSHRNVLGRWRSWLPLLPPLLLLAGTYWLNQQVQPLPPKPDNSKRHDIDYSVDNLSTVTLDAFGHARYLMTTEKMWHYPDDDTTHLQAPRFVSLHNDRAPLVTWSQTGTISSHGDEVFLYDDVKITRLGNDEKDTMVFSTDYLHLIPGKDQADTDHPVTLVTSRDTVHAVGMTLDNKTRIINLLSNVRATHEPAAK